MSPLSPQYRVSELHSEILSSWKILVRWCANIFSTMPEVPRAADEYEYHYQPNPSCKDSRDHKRGSVLRREEAVADFFGTVLVHFYCLCNSQSINILILDRLSSTLSHSTTFEINFPPFVLSEQPSLFRMAARPETPIMHSGQWFCMRGDFFGHQCDQILRLERDDDQ